MKRFVALLAFLLALGAAPAHAANCNAASGSCFWILGTGTLDLATDAAHWSNTSGGTTCACEPSGTASMTFDANSGGGTVTINANIAQTGAAAGFTCGAFTGTIDWSTHNNNFNIATSTFNCSGTGTRTINLGTGTFTEAVWNIGTTTGLTFSGASATISQSCAASVGTNTFAGGGLTYGTVNFGAGTCTMTGANTIATFNLVAGSFAYFNQGSTVTITNAPNWAGNSSNQIFVASNSSGNAATISVASGTTTCTYCGVRDMTFTGGATFTGTNSFNLGHVSGMTIVAPSGGGSVGVIGGGI